MNVFTKTVSLPEVNRREVLRYAGVKETTPEIEELLDSCIAETKNSFTCKVCYTVIKKSSLPVEIATLSRLDGYDSVVVFAATVGLEVDRLIAKYGVISPSRALIFQALGAERIEALCDSFCNSFENSGQRFSPGYGAFVLENQNYIFSTLNPSKNIGLTLNSSLLMSPSKSVTAILPLKE